MTESAALIRRHPVLFADVAVRTLFVSAALRWIPATALAKFLKDRRPKSDRHLETLHRFSQIVESRLTRKPSCLRSALVVFSMQKDLTLKVGVSGKGESFGAHAWIERKGKVFSATLQSASFELLWSLAR